MKNLIFLLLPFFCFSQVGIGTVTPQTTLHVNGYVTIDSTDYTPAATKMVVLDSLNKMGWQYIPASTGGLWTAFMNVFNSGNSAIQENAVGSYHKNDSIPLNLGWNINCGAGKLCEIMVKYSIPVGVATDNTSVMTDVGIRFFRDNIEIRSANSVGSLAYLSQAQGFHLTTTLSGFYHDWIDRRNETTSETRNYNFIGYLQQHIANQTPVIYDFRYVNYGIEKSGVINIRVHISD